MPLARALLVLAVLSAPAAALAQPEFQIEEASALGATVAHLRPHVILFSDYPGGDLPAAEKLFPFEDWERINALHRRHLSLYPGYAEPVVNVKVGGLVKPYREKLHVYAAQARFVVMKPPGSIDLARMVTPALLERIDPAIKHRIISPAEVEPLKNPEYAQNRHPERAWCEAPPPVLCVESRYDLEGQLPAGISLVNKLQEGGKVIADFIAFQSELRYLPPESIDQRAFAALTGIDAPVAGAIEQNIFSVNQIIQFGKFLLVVQQNPADPAKSIVSALMALGIETDVLERRREFEKVPVLRNLVPAQVLLGNSSFNTGQSLSAGLPTYTRNRVKAIARILEE